MPSPSTEDAQIISKEELKRLKKLKKQAKKELKQESNDTNSLEKAKKKEKKKEKKRKQSEEETVTNESVKKSKKSPVDQENALKKDKQSHSLEWKYTPISKPSEETISSYLTENEITVSNLDGSPVELDAILEFNQVSFPKSLGKALQKFPKPTSIQAVSWPMVLSGRDLVGIAATGSGKTLAFGVPVLIHILNLTATNSINKTKPPVLILSPTRELAIQIQEQIVEFASGSNITSLCIYGGVQKYTQKDALKKGTQVIVATPGRLIDLFEEDPKVCDLSQVKYLVLDEADRMLDQGFEEAIKKIIGKCGTKQSGRQTVMYSATWPTTIQKMALSYLSDPVKITVGSQDLSANARIEQRVEVLDPHKKEDRLISLLKKYHSSRKNRILIFALYKKEAARLEQVVKRQGYSVGAIHGDLNQGQRSAAIEGFKSGKIPLLIATDVAARGIDIPNVEYVINVTFPLTVEDYCHRIGRTGRAGKTGVSHTFFTVHDKTHSGALINVLKQANQKVPDELMKFGTTVKKKLDPTYGAFFKEVDMSLKPTKITFDD